MRKWLYFLLIIAVAYVVSQMGKKSKGRSFLKNISETVSIIVWVLIAVYTVGFLYWLYTELFK